MKKLERMTLGDITELVNTHDITEVGEGTVSESYEGDRDLIFKYPGEKRVIYNDEGFREKEKFLEDIDEILKRNCMYLSGVEYREQNFFTRKIKGRFYKEK